MKKNQKRRDVTYRTLRKGLLMIRWSLFFFCLGIIQVWAVDSYSQQTRFSLNYEKVKLVSVLDDIENQSEFYFLYNEDYVDVSQLVDYEGSDQRIDQVLTGLLSSKEIKYSIHDRQIVLTPAESYDPQFSGQTAGDVNGRVTDSQGEPLPGVTVIVKGTVIGTVTDSEGQYVIRDVPDNAILVFSFIGMKTVESPVGGNQQINVALQDETIGIEEVVAIGYGTVKKSDLTGAVASVTTDELVRGSKYNAINALQGAVSGVNIVRPNNKPGAGYSIDIRGLSSISKSNEPLIVVDGIPGADLALINPEDIEKIDILKDASATAIYGSRGANGVVIVTTKRGEVGKPVISYSGYVGIKTPTNKPEFMSGDDWVQLVRESYRSKNDGVYRPDEEIFTDPSELKAVQDHNYFDWVDALTRDAIQTSHTISASGGTDNSKYSISGGYYNEQGFMQKENYTRYNLKSTIDMKANDFIGFGGSIYLAMYIRDIGNNDLFQDIHRVRQTQHPFSLVTGEEIRKFSSNGIFNPMITQHNIDEQSKGTDFLGNVYIDITPGKGLEFKSTFAPYLTSNRDGRFRGTWSKALQGTSQPTAFMRTTDNYNWVWDNILNYKLAKGAHKLDFTGVFSMQKYEDEQLFGDVKDLGFESLWYNLGGGTVNRLTSNFSRNTLVSYLGRLNYNYKERYLLTLSGRYDGSSKLAKGHKWSFFPSAALAWRVSEEAFMKNQGLISNMKLRVSYGETGNNSVGPYSTSANISSTTYYMFGNSVANGNVPGSLGNSSLGWETTSEINIGLDWGILDNRFSGSFEYYNRLTEDLIMNKLIATHTGYSSVPANVGSSRNKGFEMSMNTENVRTSNFRWTTAFSLAYNKNMIVDLAYKEDLGKYSSQLEGMEGDYSNKWFIGQPIRINWIYEATGVWQLDEAEEAAKYGQVPGQWKVRDFDKDFSIHGDKDRTIYGKRSPDWIGGMTNRFTYKNLDLSAHMYWRTGLTDRNWFLIYYTGEGNQHNFKNAAHEYWTPENSTNEGAQPSNHGPYRNNHSNVWTKSDFLKISDITLGYTFSDYILQRLKMSNLRVYTTVQNPFTFTKFQGFDPENPASRIGSDSWMARTTLVGIKLTF